MNSILELPAPNEEPQATPPAPPPFDHRGNGKIARLPKLIRDQVNNWLLDGVSYPAIIKNLGEHGKDLNPGHIYQWKIRGYQDWLRQREWLEHVASKSEFATDILAAPDSWALHEAGLRLAASQMLDQFMRFSASADAADSKAQPEQFARLSNALSRLTREALAFQKFRAATAKEDSLELKRRDPNRKSSEKERDVVLHLWRDFFGHDLSQPDATDAESEPAHAPPGAVQASPQTETQQPKVQNPAVHHAENEASASEPLPAQVPPIKTQKSKIKNKTAPAEKQIDATAGKQLEELPTPVAAIEIQNSKIQNPATDPESEIEIENSKIERCYDCAAPLPSLLLNGERPSRACVACGARLFPPSTTFDQCHFCRAFQPILASGERASSECRRCKNTLAPPGQRFVMICPKCGSDLPILTAQGTRISDRCPSCRALLPLLEPLPPP